MRTAIAVLSICSTACASALVEPPRDETEFQVESTHENHVRTICDGHKPIVSRETYHAALGIIRNGMGCCTEVRLYGKSWKEFQSIRDPLKQREAVRRFVSQRMIENEPLRYDAGDQTHWTPLEDVLNPDGILARPFLCPRRH